MGEQTGISWCHATLNFWVGCTKVSNGDDGACAFCYAETWAMRWPRLRETWGVGAQRVRFKDTRAKALKLERMANASGSPFYCFSNSLSDMFDNEVPIEWLAEAFDDMRAAPHVTFLVLTKRAPLIQKRVKAAGGLPPNVALGITVVTQEEADRDVPRLLRAKAALSPRLAFLSMEPLMGPIDLTRLRPSAGSGWMDALTGRAHIGLSVISGGPAVDWVITGGESGHKARPTHPDWLRSIRDQCAAADVPYHHKQNGEWATLPDHLSKVEWVEGSGPPNVAWPDGQIAYGTADEHGGLGQGLWRPGKKHSGRLLDGVLHDAMPSVQL